MLSKATLNSLVKKAKENNLPMDILYTVSKLVTLFNKRHVRVLLSTSPYLFMVMTFLLKVAGSRKGAPQLAEGKVMMVMWKVQRR